MNESISTFLNHPVLAGNELWRILLFFVILLAGFIGGSIVKHICISTATRLKKKERVILSVAFSSVGRVMVFFFFVLALQTGFAFLLLGDMVKGIADTVNATLLIIAIAWLAYRLVDIVSKWLSELAKKTESKLDDMLIPLVRKTLRITVIILALLQVAQVLSDKPVTSLLAGLGVGGLAVALAAQDSIKNFFGSIVLLADKPFELGERVVVDGHDGPVEQMGLRSTRIRTLEGHLVTVPNSDMANKTIQNIGRRPHIRRLSTIGITYDTPPKKVRQAVEIIRDVLKEHEGMKPEFPPRVYFEGFGNFSLNIIMIYWYYPPDYWAYMEFSERVNHEILRRFNAEGIDFAFPTQTVHLAGDSKRPLKIGLTQEQHDTQEPTS